MGNNGAISPCLNCQMRTKSGDCHEFCPSYIKFKKDKAIENKRIKAERRYEEYSWNVWKGDRPRRTIIERNNHKWKDK